MEPNIALFILVDGMLLGEFTSKKLGTYVNGSKTDFLNARRVINGTDKAPLIKGLANSWLSRLNSESIFTEEIIAGASSADETPISDESVTIEELMLMQIMSS
jgi:hypothetical protein